VRFCRTSTATVLLVRPEATVTSCTLRRLSVIFFDASPSSAGASPLPCVRRRKPRSFIFSVLVTTWSGPLKLMPASDSCSSSFSTGVFTSSASLRMVVCCDIRCPLVAREFSPGLERGRF
jgi:hypothetical protein